MMERDEVERGLRFAHLLMDVNQRQARASAVMFQALANVLLRNNLISEAELRASLEQASEEAASARQPKVRLGDMGDKYEAGETVEIDCESLLHLCHARCCTFKFYLTRQDLDEGVACWDYGNPYWVRQGEDGYCVHSSHESRLCTIHERRPHVCRQFDCRNDDRIWLDFEKRIPAPMPELSGNPPIGMADIGMREAMRQSQAPRED